MTIEELGRYLDRTKPTVIQSAYSLGQTYSLSTTTVSRILKNRGYVRSELDKTWKLIDPLLSPNNGPTSLLVDTLDAYVLAIPPSLLSSATVPEDKWVIDPDAPTPVVARTLLQSLIVLNERGLLPIRSKISKTRKTFVPLTEPD